jgi:hypothetical protein
VLARDAQAAADRPARGDELASVRQEVQEDALHPVGVGLRGHVRRRVHDEPDAPLPTEAVEVRGDQADDRSQVDVAPPDGHLPGFELRHVEEVVDAAEEGAGVAEDDLQIPPASIAGSGRGEDLLGRPDDERERRAELVAHVGEEVGLQLIELLRRRIETLELGVGHAQLPVRVVELAGAEVDLRFHLLRPAPELLGELVLLAPELLQADELGHVLDAVDDVRDPPVGADDGRVHRAPVALLEAAVGPPDVVLLHRHRVGDTVREDPVDRGLQVPDAARVRVPRVVREDLEQGTAEDAFARRHGRAQIGVAHRDDGQVGGEDQIRAGRGFEERPKVGHRERAYAVRHAIFPPLPLWHPRR